MANHRLDFILFGQNLRIFVIFLKSNRPHAFFFINFEFVFFITYMTRTYFHIFISVLVVVATASCSGHKATTDTGSFTVISINSLSDSTEAVTSAELQAFLKTVGASDLNSWRQTDAARIFSPAADSVFAELKPERTVASVIANARREGLQIPATNFATGVWGKRQSILFTDSVMIVALNHYLGPAYPGYEGLPEHIRRLKTPEMLPYDIAEALTATAYPYEGDNATTISRLLYEGALTEAKMRLVDNASPSAALGYDEETYAEIEHNERELWQKILENRLLFDRDPTVAARLTAPAPFTSILGGKVPGRVGRYVGWRIVMAYLDHNPEVSLTDLLSKDFYLSDEILRRADYRP